MSASTRRRIRLTFSLSALLAATSGVAAVCWCLTGDVWYERQLVCHRRIYQGFDEQQAYAVGEVAAVFEARHAWFPRLRRLDAVVFGEAGMGVLRLSRPTVVQVTRDPPTSYRLEGNGSRRRLRFVEDGREYSVAAPGTVLIEGDAHQRWRQVCDDQFPDSARRMASTDATAEEFQAFLADESAPAWTINDFKSWRERR